MFTAADYCTCTCTPKKLLCSGCLHALLGQHLLTHLLLSYLLLLHKPLAEHFKLYLALSEIISELSWHRPLRLASNLVVEEYLVLSILGSMSRPDLTAPCVALHHEPQQQQQKPLSHDRLQILQLRRVLLKEEQLASVEHLVSPQELEHRHLNLVQETEDVRLLPVHDEWNLRVQRPVVWRHRGDGVDRRMCGLASHRLSLLLLRLQAELEVFQGFLPFLVVERLGVYVLEQHHWLVEAVDEVLGNHLVFAPPGGLD
mmetsp:Transcript_521/g.857  ORF Transcript_521/g.857 Transcript_521/m.857 type:complete len:257 (-) Transcript_521:2089-2859(-)